MQAREAKEPNKKVNNIWSQKLFYFNNSSVFFFLEIWLGGGEVSDQLSRDCATSKASYTLCTSADKLFTVKPNQL